MTVNITTNSCVQLKFTQHISSVWKYNWPSVLNYHHLITNSQQLYKAKSFNQQRSILRNYIGNYDGLWYLWIELQYRVSPYLLLLSRKWFMHYSMYRYLYSNRYGRQNPCHVHTHQMNTKESRLETSRTKEPFIRFHSRLHFLPHVSLDRAILATKQQQEIQQQ